MEKLCYFSLFFFLHIFLSSKTLSLESDNNSLSNQENVSDINLSKYIFYPSSRCPENEIIIETKEDDPKSQNNNVEIKSKRGIEFPDESLIIKDKYKKYQNEVQKQGEGKEVILESKNIPIKDEEILLAPHFDLNISESISYPIYTYEYVNKDTPLPVSLDLNIDEYNPLQGIGVSSINKDKDFLSQLGRTKTENSFKCKIENSYNSLIESSEKGNNFIEEFSNLSSNISKNCNAYTNIFSYLDSNYTKYINVNDKEYNDGYIELMLNYNNVKGVLRKKYNVYIYGSKDINDVEMMYHFKSIILEQDDKTYNHDENIVISEDENNLKQLLDKKYFQNIIDYKENKICESIIESKIDYTGNFFTLNKVNQKFSVSKLEDFLDKCFEPVTTNNEIKIIKKKINMKKKDLKNKKSKYYENLLKEFKESLVTKNLEKCKLSYNMLKVSSGFSNIVSFFALVVIIIYMFL